MGKKKTTQAAPAAEKTKAVEMYRSGQPAIKVSEGLALVQCCALCRFWKRPPGEPGAVAVREAPCRRYPPHALAAMATSSVSSPWPVTCESDWCGEFKIKAEGRRQNAEVKEEKKTEDAA